MLRIGLTGGIGSGKSTVCRLFAELGIPIIDADAIAHGLVAPGQPALVQLTAAFGSDILDPHGALNRAQLRERVFNNETERLRLESILHPLIRQRMHEQLATSHTAYVIIAIPLLLEKHWQDEVDRILVIDADEQLQIDRTTKRDGISSGTVRRIMHTQVSRHERLAAADDIIHNNGGPEVLQAQVLKLHRHYMQLAASHGE